MTGVVAVPTRGPTRRRTLRAEALAKALKGTDQAQLLAVLVQLVQLEQQLVLLVEVVPESISSGESAKSRTSKVSDSNCSSS